MLRNYGYTSANIGKLHFLPHANRDHRSIHPDYGFDHLEISDEPGCYEDAYRAWVRKKDPDQLDAISLGLPPAAGMWESIARRGDTVAHPEERFPKEALAFRGPDHLTHSAFVAEQTMEFIRAHRDRPFCCIGGFYSPHSPWVAPQRFLDMYDPDALTIADYPDDVAARRTGLDYSDEERRAATHGYYAMVSEVDAHVGRILRCLDEEGLSDDTIVVFTSDHGEFLGDFLHYGKGFPAPDCISRVPLIIRWPAGLKRTGQTIHHIAEAVDVVPTLLSWAGIPIPRHLQGRPLPATADEPATRASALTEMNGARSLRTDNYRYIVRANGTEALHDLTSPEGEYRNVAHDPAYSDSLCEHRRTLIERMLDMERPLPRTAQY
jgi:arylsulfatase A-like enzyme